jgi:hypothetical protein
VEAQAKAMYSSDGTAIDANNNPQNAQETE